LNSEETSKPHLVENGLGQRAKGLVQILARSGTGLEIGQAVYFSKRQNLLARHLAQGGQVRLVAHQHQNRVLASHLHTTSHFFQAS